MFLWMRISLPELRMLESVTSWEEMMLLLVHRLLMLQTRSSSHQSNLTLLPFWITFCIQVSQTFQCFRVQEFRRFSEKSDVYAFGVFLLELVSGREASEPSPSSSTQTLVEWVCNHYHKMLDNESVS